MFCFSKSRLRKPSRLRVWPANTLPCRSSSANRSSSGSELMIDCTMTVGEASSPPNRESIQYAATDWANPWPGSSRKRKRMPRWQSSAVQSVASIASISRCQSPASRSRRTTRTAAIAAPCRAPCMSVRVKSAVMVCRHSGPGCFAPIHFRASMVSSEPAPVRYHALKRFIVSRKRATAHLFCLAQFRTGNRFTLFRELL